VSYAALTAPDLHPVLTNARYSFVSLSEVFHVASVHE
jgi:hypothetical protein